MDQNQLIRRLKATHPRQLAVHAPGAEPTVLGVPQVKRWASRTVALLCQYDWTRIECLDGKGAVIDCIDAPERVDAAPPVELEDLGNGTGQLATQRALLEMMLRAQDVALSRQQQMTQSLVDNNVRLLDAVSSQLVQLQRHHTDALARVQEYASALAELQTAAQENDQLGDLLKAVPTLVPLLRPLLAGFAPSPRATKA